MRIAIAQYNPIVGDIDGNVRRMGEYIERARDGKCDLVVFSELSITGSPPKDLLYDKDFITATKDGLDKLIALTEGIGVIVGTIMDADGDNILYNSGLLLENGSIKGRVDKSLLKDYDIYDELRYFRPSKSTKCIEFRGTKIGLTIGDDISGDWKLFRYERRPRNIIDELYSEAPDIFINISASPYYYGKYSETRDRISDCAKEYVTPFIYVNQVGGNDELVFHGSGMVYNENGELILRCGNFEEDMAIYDTEKTYPKLADREEDISWIHKGLILGLGDYFRKNGFTKAILGISGGVDSAIAAYMGAEALGRENILGVAIPSPYTSQESMEDARALCTNLGIEYREIGLGDIFDEYLNIFNDGEEPTEDLAEENIQARIRGSMLMFISNREGRVLLCPTNKSEMAIGYTTLYGDAAGGIAPMGDLFKTEVYDLCRYVNRNGEIIPENIITKAPTAELKSNQKDEDSLPPYPILDGILRSYIEEGMSLSEILMEDYDRETVYRVVNMVQRAEYKRRQTPPVIKLSNSGFGAGRRYPIVHGFKPGV